MKNSLFAIILVFGLTGCSAFLDALLADSERCTVECHHCHVCGQHSCTCK